MTLYADLCGEFVRWRDSYFENEMTTNRLVRQIAEEFQKYIGAPKNFKMHDEPEEEYVTLSHATDVGNGKVLFDKPRSQWELLSIWEDGYYHFGLSIALETGPNHWPKQSFPIPMYIIIKDKTCAVHVTNRNDGEFEFEIGEVANQTKMFNYILAIISENLRKKPWDRVESHGDFGFLPIR